MGLVMLLLHLLPETEIEDDIGQSRKRWSFLPRLPLLTSSEGLRLSYLETICEAWSPKIATKEFKPPSVIINGEWEPPLQMDNIGDSSL